MLNKNEIDYKLIKSKKYKRITISIKKTQEIVVCSPRNVSNNEINKLLYSKKDWILKNLNNLESSEKTKKHSYCNKDEFLFFGNLYSLNLQKSEYNQVYLDKEKNELVIKANNLEVESIKKIIFNYYKKQTEKIVYEFFEEKNELKDLYKSINSIKIHKANTRWGSCSNKNNINFSNRLAMLPISCIEYVIYHEIAHLKIRNHSNDFYNLLEKLNPNYKKQEKIIRLYEKNYNLFLV